MKNILSRFIILLALFCCVNFLCAQKPANREYQIKAAFLFNFSQFVEWPGSVYPSPQSPLVIGILGTDPFGSFLDQTIQGEQANGHPLVVQRFATLEEVEGCQILFISRSEASNMSTILPALRGKNILTVSDAPDFIQQGGIVRFITTENKIKFQINPNAAKASGLTISSKLLRLAEIVNKK